MNFNKKVIIAILTVILICLLSSCKKKEEKRESTVIPEFEKPQPPLWDETEPSGIYIIERYDKWGDFFGEPVPKDRACMEFDLKKKKGQIQFIESEERYEVDIKEVGELSYEINYNGKVKSFQLGEEPTGGRYMGYSLFFPDSFPYSKNKGTSENNGYKQRFVLTFGECIDGWRAQYKVWEQEAEINEKEKKEQAKEDLRKYNEWEAKQKQKESEANK